MGAAAAMPKGVPIQDQPKTRAGKPRGRPSNAFRDRQLRISQRMIGLMVKVVTDDTHPWHDECAKKFVIEVARLTTPRLTEITGKDGGPMKFADVQSLIYMDAIDADFEEVEVASAQQGTLALPDGEPE